MKSLVRRNVRWAAAAWVFIAVSASGCLGRVHTYEVRGQVMRALPPAQAEDMGMLVLLHEAIADFRDQKGKKVGMEPMTMSFSTARELLLHEIGPGDKVRVRFDVRWKKDPRLLITELEKLDPATQLELGGYSLEF